MLTKARRTATRLARSLRTWRGLVVIPVLAVSALAPLILPLSLGQRLIVSFLMTAVVTGIFTLVLIEGDRQDKLRGALGSELRRVAARAADRSDGRAIGRRIQSDSSKISRNTVPTVTIVVTAFNEAPFIEDCLKSVQSQTWQDIECIVVDDQSTDDTLNRAFEAFGPDHRFSFLHNETNLGLAGSRNVGLEAARGQLITFLDADDFMYPRSVEERVLAFLRSNDTWCAGAYCLWHSIEQEAPLSDDPPVVSDRDKVTWLGSLTDSPFIASAPLLDIRAVRLVGGFNASLRTAEDFDLWSRLLRHGYTVECANYTGIAYRQKSTSMFRTGPRLHSSITQDVYAYNFRSLDPQEIHAGAPFVYDRAGPDYLHDLALFRRQLIALVGLVAEGRESAANEVIGEIEKHMPWASHVVDIQDVLTRSARRINSYTTEALRARTELLTRRSLAALSETWEPEEGQAWALLEASPSDQLSGDARPIPDGTLRLIDRDPLPASAIEEQEDFVAIMPSATYHMMEAGPLALELRGRGHNVAFVAIPKRKHHLVFESAKFDTPLIIVGESDSELDLLAEKSVAMVTLNDWGDYKHHIERGNRRKVPTFGKVEGVQDFEDVDVHWQRCAYQTVAHVLCQGQNDYEALRGDRSIIGSTRLERIWQEPARHGHEPLAIINLNFTYGVMSDARDMWLASAVEACRLAGIPYLISAHPAESSNDLPGPVASQSMRHVLTEATVLISRFSTVPFESMARGVPFVYHNPHGERVPTFQNPDDAFRVTRSAKELGAAIRESQSWLGSFRERSSAFFLSQVDIRIDARSEVRTADVIEQAL